MATKTSLIINAVNEGKTLQKAIADVNPQATTAELKAFAQVMLGLTDYTYTSGALVERTGIDGEIPFSTGTFWLGDEQLEFTVNPNADTEFICTIPFAELSANESVTHDTENQVYKFTIVTRDIYRSTRNESFEEPPVPLPTSGGLLQFPNSNVEIRKWAYVTTTNVEKINGYWWYNVGINCTVPDEAMTGEGVFLGRYYVLATPRTKAWRATFNIDCT